MTDVSRLSGHLEDLRATAVAGSHWDLARRHIPVIMLDEAEPYPPLAMGYTVFVEAGQSPSSKFQVVPQGGPVIEYAIWYDWDIQHMYDLEHIWVYLDKAEQPVRVDASRHGNRVAMQAEGGRFLSREGRAVVYSEAGKHAHWADGEEMRAKAGTYLPAMCCDLAAFEGVHLGNRYCESGLVVPEGLDHRLAKLQMRADAFLPVYRFYPAVDSSIALVPWPLLDSWIPERVRLLMSDLRQRMPRINTILVDGTLQGGRNLVCGTTLVPGLGDMLRRLRNAGYRLVLLADDMLQGAAGLMKDAGLFELFDSLIKADGAGSVFEAEEFSDLPSSWTLVLSGSTETVAAAKARGVHTAELIWTHKQADRAPQAGAELQAETPIDFLSQLKPLEERMAETARTQVAVRSA
ncbi:HAD family hydrolase [Roseibium litorale]|uniref:HAD family hydrolase n=1 Tax=Roseibium litorale TaxID=2803841 RepID=A0ABR9CN28_9HYPH|nr:HAD family hydrolase [Roseibium litorale]MBD8892279.1 HAD family hydrolase [Roseibium litorale]